MKIINRNSFFLVLFFVLFTGLSAEAEEGLEKNTRYFISTEWFDIVFPSELEKEAQYVANVLEATSEYVYSALDDGHPRRRRWTIFLTNDSFYANGWVSAAPRRSEWYELPLFDALASLEWYAILASHETRHMAQMDNLNKGIIPLLNVLFGDYGFLLGMGGALPLWYIEGDATLTETLLSQGGRGRQASFIKEYKALVLGPYKEHNQTSENVHSPSLDQMIHRSYKRYIPSRYVLGYHLVQYIRQVYGPDAWNSIVENAAWLPIPTLGLGNAVRSVTGKSLTAVYADMETRLAETWGEQHEILKPGSAPLHLPFWRNAVSSGQEYSRIRGYAVNSDGSVNAAVYDFKNGTSIRRIPNGMGVDEGTLLYSDLVPMRKVSFGNNTAVWTERIIDPIDSRSASGEIMFLDLESMNKSQITKSGRYHQAVLNSNGTVIAGLSFSKARESAVDILVRDGSLWRQIISVPFPAGYHGAHINSIGTQENADTRLDLLITYTSPGGMGVAELSIDLNSLKYSIRNEASDIPWLLGPAWKTEDGIIVEGDMKGLQGIWLLKEGNQYLITAGAYGSQNPVTQDQNLYFVNYTSEKGDEISVIRTEDILPALITEVPDFSTQLFYENGLDDLSDTAAQPFSYSSIKSIPYSPRPVKKYPVAKQLPRYHSWVPSISLDMEDLSIFLLADDLDGNVSMITSGAYSLHDGSWDISHIIQFNGLFPRIGVGGSIKRDNNAESYSPGGVLQIGFPVQFRKGYTAAYADISAEGLIENVPGGIRLPLMYSGSLGVFEKKGFSSYQPIYSIDAAAFYGHIPVGPGSGMSAGAQFSLAIPGGPALSGLRVYTSSVYDSGYFSEMKLLAPGYDMSDSPLILRAGISWDCPIAYPDQSLLHILFTRRLRLGLYGDAGWEGGSFSLSAIEPAAGKVSARAGLISDFSLLHLDFVEVSLGFGYGYRFENGGNFDRRQIFPWLSLQATVAE